MTYNAVSSGTDYGVQYPGYVFPGPASQGRSCSPAAGQAPPDNPKSNNKQPVYCLSFDVKQNVKNKT